MMEEFAWLLPFILIAVEIGFLSGTVGAYIYTRELSGIVGGLSHFLLGPIGLAYVASFIIGESINISFFTIFFMVIVGLILPIDSKGKIKAHNEIQILWSAGMASGLLIMFLLPGYLNLDIFLFGSLLVISKQSVMLITIFTIIVLSIEFIFHNRFKYLGIDDDFLKVRGINPKLYHRLQLIIIVISINLLLESIGILLMITIFTVPAAISSLFVRKNQNLIISSICISVIGLIAGILLSYRFNVQLSPVISMLLCVGYMLVRISLKARRRR